MTKTRPEQMNKLLNKQVCVCGVCFFLLVYFADCMVRVGARQNE